MDEFEGEENCSEINHLWLNFSKWYKRKKEGLSASLTLTKGKVSSFFIQFKKRW